jgi:16S rRNA (cytosine967-C5)-methyltransferase
MDIEYQPVRILNDKIDRENPREIALLILNHFFKKTESLKDIINKHFKDCSIPEIDRRFIFNIVKGTVRYYLKIDFVLSLFSKKDVKDIDFIVLNILRTGVYQLMYMDKVPDYSTLNESVNLTKKKAGLPSSKFVNAVLRKISSLSDINTLVEKKIKEIKDETIKFSIQYSYPSWLVKYWLKWYGKEKTILILESLNKNPLYYLRFNREKISINELAKMFGLKMVRDIFRDTDAGRSNNRGIINSEGNKSSMKKDTKFLEEMLDNTAGIYSVQGISETEVFKKGLITIQDLSSQLVVRYFLNPGKGDRVLDVCAAPGGKTSYIAEILGNKGELVSVDISVDRLGVLRDNISRMGIKNVKVISADAAGPGFLDSTGSEGSGGSGNGKESHVFYNEYFDSILIDAPCSAFGTISKNPDAKYSKTIDDVTRLSGMSYKMMLNCDRYLKTGGRIVFYTCTMSPIENQKMIEKFLNKSGGRYIPEKSKFLRGLSSILDSRFGHANNSPGGCFEIMPYYFGSEAGFVCSLKKVQSG